MNGLATLLARVEDGLGPELATILRVYVFPVIGVVGILWALYLGFQFGMAKDEQSRQNAKQRLVKAVAIIVIIAICYGILAYMNGGVGYGR